MEEGKQAGNEPTPLKGQTRVPVNLHPPRRSATETADHGDFYVSITEGNRCLRTIS